MLVGQVSHKVTSNVSTNTAI